MQENLDVVISFVVIIIALSVFLQLTMDMIKNILNLKWGVYEEFLKRIYSQSRNADGSKESVIDLPFDVFRKDKGSVAVLESPGSKIKNGKSLGLDDVNDMENRIDSAVPRIGKNS